MQLLHTMFYKPDQVVSFYIHVRCGLFELTNAVKDRACMCMYLPVVSEIYLYM